MCVKLVKGRKILFSSTQTTNSAGFYKEQKNIEN